MSNQAKRAQAKAIEWKLEEMLEWYASNSGGKLPEQQCEDKKPYRGIIRRWFEPLLPGLENPCLIEEQLGDYWTLYMVPVTADLKLG